MRWKILIVGTVIVLAFSASWTAGRTEINLTKTAAVSRQDEMAVFKGNECVWCHSRISNPLRLTSRYADWHISAHKVSGVGCDKCHGGKPGEANQQRSHSGMLPTSNPESRLNPKNLATTCQECHQSFVAAYTGSRHYQALKGTGLGPSCNTCHGHMASEVIYTPEQAGAMCATCHDSMGSSLPRNSAMATGAQEAMQSIRRAAMMVAWANRLIDEAEKRRLATDADRRDLAEVRSRMIEAKAGFHTFEMGSVREKADGAWAKGMALKDSLRRRLYPNQ